MFSKVINPAKIEGKNVFVKIQYNNGNLSLSGVEGPRRDGDAWGSCGQIYDNIPDYTPAAEWTIEMLNKLQAIWATYHLNNLTPNCVHMRDAGIVKYTPDHVCPICGYKSGTKWLTRSIPADVIEWLESLPETKITPAWV